MTKQTKFMRDHNVIIGKARECGIDPEGGAWFVICKIHRLIFNVKRLRDAKLQAINLCWEQCAAFDETAK